MEAKGWSDVRKGMKGTTSQVIQETSEDWRRQGDKFSPEVSRKNTPLPTP